MQSYASRCVGLFLLLAANGFAHEELGNYLQHRIQLKASDDTLDVTIEITFDALHSLAERKAMDTNHDGALSSDERNAYLKEIAANAEKAIKLAVDSAEVDLLTLYPPKLDLLGSKDMEAHPHLVQLSFFARAKVADAKTVRVEEQLWAETPAMMLAVAAADSRPMLVAREEGKDAQAVRAAAFDVLKALPGKAAPPKPRGNAPRKPAR